MRTRVPIVWGQGLDRATGVLAVDKSTFLDLRNLLVRDSKLLSRGGLVQAGDPFTSEDTPTTDIIGVFPFRAQLGLVVVTYNRTTRSIDVWQADGFGESATFLGNWDTLLDGAPLPIVTGAESFGMFFLAHAEPLFNYRIKTIYYDPSQDPGSQIIDFDQDLDGGGSAHTFFRGVFAYLDYLMCYGFGSAGDPNRPELIHATLPGQPTVMDPQQYFIAGALGEAVTGMCIAAGILRVNKKGRSYAITGTGAADFGINPLEEIYGQVNDRASFQFGASAIMWSEQGPRMCGMDGTAITQDIALPLELDGPQPDTLAQRGDDAYCWSVYEPEQRIGLFGFPILDPVTPKTLVYVLSLRTPGVIRWTYFEINQCLYTACLLIEGAPSVGSTLTAYSSDVAVSDTGQSGTGRTVHVAWESNALIGGETAQVIAKKSGGVAAILGSLPATVGAMSFDLTSLRAFSDYEIGVRYVKGGFATSGYESIDPDDWTAGTAAGSIDSLTTSASAITDFAVVWARTSPTDHSVTATWTQLDTDLGYRLQVSDDGATWTDAEVEAAPYNTRAIVHPMMDADIGETKRFRLRAELGGNNGAYVTLASVYIGPGGTPSILALVQTAAAASSKPLSLWLAAKPAPGDKIEIQDSADGTTWSSRLLTNTSATQYPFASSVAGGHTVHCRARWIHTSFGVDDPGEFDSPVTISFLTLFSNPAAATHVALTWQEINQVKITCDALVASLVAVYENETGDAQEIAIADPTDTELDLVDIHDKGDANHYIPWEIVTDVVAPSEPVTLYNAVRTAGAFCVSAATVHNVLMSEPDDTKPLGVLVTQPTPGVGQINVEWGNSDEALADAWGVSVTWATLGNNLAELSFTVEPPASGGTQDMSGPPFGLPPLPGPGTKIRVRVVYRVRGASGDDPGRYGNVVDTIFTMS